jgi:hypothetical protein
LTTESEIPLKRGDPDDDGRAVTASTPLIDLRLGETRPGRSESRVARVRAEVQAGTYVAPPELVAEALLASSLIGLAPDERAVFWAF